MLWYYLGTHSPKNDPHASSPPNRVGVFRYIKIRPWRDYQGLSVREGKEEKQALAYFN